MQQVFDIRGREWTAFPRRRQSSLLHAAFDLWRTRGFPYYALGEAEVRRELSNLAQQDVAAVFSPEGLTGSNVGLRLANNFHPQMWSVRVSRYRSPMDVFEDDTLLRAALERAWRIWPDRFGARPSSLRRILKSFPGAASVSNFRPTLSRAITARFAPGRATVVDFSSGYGGRMLGCLSVGRRYVGIEPCRDQIRGSLAMLKAIRGGGLPAAGADLHHGCAEDVLPTLPARCASLVFSSPPYYDWERYSDQPSQSFLRYPSYEQWRSEFLGRIVAGSRRVLKRGGYLVLNISGKERRPSRADVEELAARCRFALHSVVPILLARIPYLHPRQSGPYKPELLLVFQKR